MKTSTPEQPEDHAAAALQSAAATARALDALIALDAFVDMAPVDAFRNSLEDDTLLGAAAYKHLCILLRAVDDEQERETRRGCETWDMGWSGGAPDQHAVETAYLTKRGAAIVDGAAPLRTLQARLSALHALVAAERGVAQLRAEQRRRA